MLIDLAIGIGIVISILFVLYISCHFLRKYDQKEHFSNNIESLVEESSLEIKKTLNFKHVYKSKKFSVWEPIPIDDYFPIGQYVTIDHTPPKKPAVLIKTKMNHEYDKPVKYSILAMTPDKYGIWKPVPNKNYSSVGHIFSKDYPSRHTIRCPSKEHLVPCSLKDKCIENRDFAIWTIEDSDLFLANDINHSSVPHDKPHTINLNKIKNITPLKIKNTRKYKKILEINNDKLNKTATFWRPIAPEGYVSLGDIVISNKLNPNNNIESVVVSIDQVKYPLHFGSHFIEKMPNGKENNVSFWKPEAPEGYVSLGLVLNDSLKEPHSNTIVGCIPIEYTITDSRECSNSRNMIWNNVPNKNLISVHSDSSNRFILSKGLGCNENSILSLNPLFIHLDKDNLDIPREVVFDYELNPDNTINYSELEREEYLKKTLSNRFEISESRFTNIRFDITKRKIFITIDSRLANTTELSVGEILVTMRKTLINDPIKIFNKKHNHYISKLTYMDVLKSDSNKILIDNSMFKNETK